MTAQRLDHGHPRDVPGRNDRDHERKNENNRSHHHAIVQLARRVAHRLHQHPVHDQIVTGKPLEIESVPREIARYRDAQDIAEDHADHRQEHRLHYDHPDDLALGRADRHHHRALAGALHHAHEDRVRDSQRRHAKNDDHQELVHALIELDHAHHVVLDLHPGVSLRARPGLDRALGEGRDEGVASPGKRRVMVEEHGDLVNRARGQAPQRAGVLQAGECYRLVDIGLGIEDPGHAEKLVSDRAVHTLRECHDLRADFHPQLLGEQPAQEQHFAVRPFQVAPADQPPVVLGHVPLVIGIDADERDIRRPLRRREQPLNHHALAVRLDVGIGGEPLRNGLRALNEERGRVVGFVPGRRDLQVAGLVTDDIVDDHFMEAVVVVVDEYEKHHADADGVDGENRPPLVSPDVFPTELQEVVPHGAPRVFFSPGVASSIPARYCGLAARYGAAGPGRKSPRPPNDRKALSRSPPSSSRRGRRPS